MTDLDVREARPDDLPGILETLRLSLGESSLLQRSEELWRWKHIENPFGSSIVLIAMSQGGDIAGVRALMRWSLRLGSETLTCVRPVDTATHPSFRRMGIFRTLTLQAVEVARDDDVHLIFNTPNERSAPGYAAMGWGEVGTIGVQARPRLGPAIAAEEGQPSQIDTWAPGAESIGPGVALGPLFAETGRLRTTPDLAYAGWRYGSHPYASYGLVRSAEDAGLIVRASSRNGRSETVVADFQGTPDAKAIRTAARISRARYLAGWFSPGTVRRRASVAGGLLPIPGVKTLRLMANPLLDIGIDVFDLGSWDLSTSDLELL